MCVNLLLLVRVELDLDTLDASIALMDAARCQALLRSASAASVFRRPLLSRGSVPAFPRTWVRRVRTRSA